MADDRMRNDEREKNMGGAGQQNKDEFGQQTPGRKQQDDLSTGQRGGQGQQNKPRHEDDEEFGTGQTGQRDQNR